MLKYNIKLKDEFEGSNMDLQLVLEIDEKSCNFNGEVLGWSNDEQEYVNFDNSNCKEFYDEKKFERVKSYYQKFLDEYLNYLKQTYNTPEKLKNFIDLLETPPVNYNQKLINSFGDRLDSFVRDYLEIKPILDKNTMEIVPETINGWYGDEIEVSCDMSDDEFVKIEDLENGCEVIDVDEFFKRILRRI